MTQEDIDSLAKAIVDRQDHPCRFESIEPDELKDVVKFVRSLQGAVCESNASFRKAVITVLVGAAATFIWNVGPVVWTKAKFYFLD